MTKAVLKVEGQEKPIPVLFNPKEYSLSTGIQCAEKKTPGKKHPVNQYISGNSKSLNVALFFDTYIPPSLDNPEEGGMDVTIYTSKIVKLAEVDDTLKKVPTVTFAWGNMSFTGIIQNVKENYTMFLADGKPVRAKLDLSFKSVPVEHTDAFADKKKDEAKTLTVAEGDTLCSIAKKEYGDARYWRIIALVNGILNPLEIKKGMVLTLPPKESKQ
ncbi:MAG: hypothetical protein K2I10_00910 [Lachnospiraceae bacterium]|nr:hypothetical protein [Lachnospiraceae bacterium]